MCKYAIPVLFGLLLAGPALAQGNAEKGQEYFVVCQTCHGAGGEGSEALGAPRLAGQYGWYLTRQLNNFKAGLRGTHADDLYGQQMAPMATTLSDDQAVTLEPLSVGVHTVNQGQVHEGDSVLILGGGPIGLLTAAMARVR